MFCFHTEVFGQSNEKRDNIWRDRSLLNLRIFSSYRNVTSPYDSHILSSIQAARIWKLIKISIERLCQSIGGKVKSACSSSVVCGGQLLQLRHEVALQRRKTLLNKTVTFFNCYSWSLKGWHRYFAFRLVSDRIMRCSETPKLILFPNWRFAGNNDQVFPVTAVNGRHWSIILSSVFQEYVLF